jgi:hypothetical protein
VLPLQLRPPRHPPACDGRYEPTASALGKLVIVDATTWPGVPIAAWPAIQPKPGGKPVQDYTPP